MGLMVHQRPVSSFDVGGSRGDRRRAETERKDLKGSGPTPMGHNVKTLTVGGGFRIGTRTPLPEWTRPATPCSPPWSDRHIFRRYRVRGQSRDGRVSFETNASPPPPVTGRERVGRKF